MIGHEITIRDKLKHYIKPFHDSIESGGYGAALFEGKLDSQSYIAWLKSMYSFHYHAEKRLEDFGEEFAKYGIELQKRVRAQKALLDLKNLGEHRVEIIPMKMPRIENSAHALGVLYVLEGSTMGGEMIAKELKKTLGEDIPTSYFNPYGEQKMEMWMELLESLKKMALDIDSDEEIILAACGTFLYFGREDL